MVVPPTSQQLQRQAGRRARRDSARQARFEPKLTQNIINIIQSADYIGIYSAIGAEADPLTLPLSDVNSLALPWMGSESDVMFFRRWQAGDMLRRGAHDIPQPDDRAPMVEPSLLIVPIVAFDVTFARIGQGGGYYDRYMAAHPDALRLGLAWESQRVEKFERNPWDIPLDVIVTERMCRVNGARAEQFGLDNAGAA